MSDRAALLDAVVARPDDDTPRVVLADWLDDHGEADRAEFIRLQCRLATLEAADTGRAPLEARELELLTGNASGWAAPRPAFPGLVPSVPSEAAEGYRSVFRRGFVEALQFTRLVVDDLRPGGPFETAFAAHPVRDLDLYHLMDGVPAALAVRPELERVETLTLRHHGEQRDQPDATRRAAEIGALLGSPRLTRLRRLEVVNTFPWMCPPGWLRLPAFAGLAALTVHPPAGGWADVLAELEAGRCPDLRHLGLNWSPGEDAEAAAAFARGSVCRGLTSARVSCLDGTNFPWADVFHTARLERLGVSAGSGTDVPGLNDALAQTPGGRMTGLRLWGIVCTDADPARWLDRGYAEGVRELELSHVYLSDRDLDGLAATPALARLTRLDISGYQSYTPAGLAALFTSPHLAGLRHLSLTVPRGADGAVVLRHLAEYGTPRRLTSLRVEWESPPADDGEILGLVAGGPFPALHTVMTYLTVKPAVLKELLLSPALPVLRSFRATFGSHPLGDVTTAAAVRANVWVGGSVSDSTPWGWSHVAVQPQTVFLPNHLDKPSW